MKQLQLRFDQDTESPISDLPIREYDVERNGETITMFYRRYSDIPTMPTGNWWYRPEHSDEWRPVKSQQIRRKLDRGIHPDQYYFRPPDTDMSNLEAFFMDIPYYDLDIVEETLKNHPFVDESVWEFLLEQKTLYKNEIEIERKHFAGWAAPNWDMREYGLYKASRERQTKIFRLAYDVLLRVKPCPVNHAAK